MFTVKSLALLKSLPLRHKENGEYETALVEEEQKIYQYKDGDWVEYKSPEGFTVSLIELNSMAVTQLKPMTKSEIKKDEINPSFLIYPRVVEFRTWLLENVV